MDPVTVAIVAALTKLGDTVIKDAYEALKGLLKRKFGSEKGVAQAVSALEEEPSSPERKAVLQEQVAASGADRDEEILRAAEAVTEKVRGGYQAASSSCIRLSLAIITSLPGRATSQSPTAKSSSR